MIVAHAAVADATEGKIVDTGLDHRFVDADATGNGVVHVELLQVGIVAVHIERQRPRTVADVLDHVFLGLVGQDRQQRAEDLALHDVHAVIDVDHDARRHDPARLVGCRSAVKVDQLGALGDGIGGGFPQAVVGALVDDRRVIAVVDVWEALADDRFRFADEFLDLVFGKKQVIDVGADLAGIEHLRPDDAFSGGANRVIGRHDARGLAAEFERDRGEILRGIGHHRLAGGGRAGEEDVIERQGRELGAATAAILEKGELVFREIVR